MSAIIKAQNICVSINDKEIVHNLSLEIPEGKVTAIIGPNGCGKSTTLKALSRILPYKGSVTFKGNEMSALSQREFAKSLAILTQSPQAPSDLTVNDLVEMGRFPHRGFLGRGGKDDKEHVEWALAQTGVTAMRNRLLNTLSGGERQRAWIAMALAQRPEVLLLDEPTTYLDICHQLEIMQLIGRLNQELGLTVVMVVHDLNHAIMYADHVVVVKAGKLVTSGAPREIITAELLAEVFKVKADEFTLSNDLRALVPVDLYK
ncbi:MAG: ABC transporter ATP-binding protein [Phascolarctobacterium sp.]|nr:ABC transporter ATP-binding protein [Phascolarctobacterium sp.]MBR6637024.1 ABC transporter ATP-binding protein [Phascolarctobacterium sp.]